MMPSQVNQVKGTMNCLTDSELRVVLTHLRRTQTRDRSRSDLAAINLGQIS